MLRWSLQEGWDVVRVVLAVGIHGDDCGESRAFCASANRTRRALPFSAVLPEDDDVGAGCRAASAVPSVDPSSATITVLEVTKTPCTTPAIVSRALYAAMIPQT